MGFRFGPKEGPVDSTQFECEHKTVVLEETAVVHNDGPRRAHV